MPIATTNPATGETVRVFEEHTAAQVEEKLARAHAAFLVWRKSRFPERAALLKRISALFAEKRETLAQLMTLEMGKLKKAALAEVDKCAGCFLHYAENGERYLAEEEIPTDARKSYVRHDPLGVILAIMPWNFPLWQVVRFAAPALMAGNVGLLKHANNVPQTALALEAILLDAGAIPGAFQALFVEVDKVPGLMADPRIVAATLTGSDRAGRSLGEQAGKNLKKLVLELGGSDPFLVLPSADLDKTAEIATHARVQNAGQSCIAAKRFIVHKDVYAAFAEKFVARMKALQVGDPGDESTQLGPLCSKAAREGLHAQVEETVAMGGKLLAGGAPVAGPGFFYQATVIAEAPKDSPARTAELFGPVAALIRADSIDEMIAIANETLFGLGAAAFTQDEGEIARLAVELEAGSVFFNGMVKSDPRLPFGGIKTSGYGRELSALGIREFVNAKTVWIGA
jgi:succinate-semialdehyde dehydrogenase/glutarate-semialdehyde dehydrogenase